uniref:(California timema) hypothetical protein n=1 Tax=Timema californicum TaxID=61474 RepID=A0A7R9P8W8_TIMCA|nr:unnamed protein product [Timema californicum]
MVRLYNHTLLPDLEDFNPSFLGLSYLGQGFVTEQTGIIEIAYVGSPRADCSNMDRQTGLHQNVEEWIEGVGDPECVVESLASHRKREYEDERHTVCTREYRLHWLNDLRQYCRIADDRKIPKYMCKELHQNIHVCPLILVGPVLVPEAVSVSYSSKLILNDGEGKNLSTLDRDLNLDFLVISSLVYYESSVLVHVATEGYEHRCIKPEVLVVLYLRPPKYVTCSNGPGVPARKTHIAAIAAIVSQIYTWEKKKKWYQRMSKPEGRRLKELVYLWINAGVIA